MSQNTSSMKQDMFFAPTIYTAEGKPRIQRVLIANRGEIACRIIRACQRTNIASIAIYTDPDRDSLHVKQATEAYYLGPPDSQPYLNWQLLIDIAKKAGVDAIHPGYGYLSENADFARAVEDAGILFIGPTPEAISALGDKREAKTYLKENSQVPLIPGYSGLNQDADFLEGQADSIGYPVMIKASAGGGGKGMRIVRTKAEFRENFTRCVSEAQRSFGSGHCLVEKYIEAGKHVEIQIFGDGETSISLLDRECSVQRRHQKVVEESPCPWLSAEMRERMSDAALEISQLLHYRSAGTIEFIVDVLESKFYFLEVNTRIQVEHPITEEVTGIDIVALQLYIAAGGKLADLPRLQHIQQHGHSIEVRLCAEDPFNNFLPCNGTIQLLQPCHIALGLDNPMPDIRYESGIESGAKISVYFDSMISKVVVWAEDRRSAIHKMLHVLRHTICLGITTNLMFLQRILAHPAFQRTDYTTAFIDLYKETLLQPVDDSVVVSTLAIAANAFVKRHAEAQAGNVVSAFRTIPRSFRNQRKDKTAGRVTVLTADLRALGHSSSVSIILQEESPERIHSRLVRTEEKPSPKELKAFGNVDSGLLVKRYYANLRNDNDTTSQAHDFHIHNSTIDQQNELVGGRLRASIDGVTADYFVALGARDELQKTVYIQCPSRGISATYTIQNKLSWAGKLSERVAGGSVSSGTNPKNNHNSPLPGKVLQILSPSGTKVKPGDGLLVLESMKMEVRIVAEAEGVVRMLVSEGEGVSEGKGLCVVDVEGEGDGGERVGEGVGQGS